ncbi:MAG TPA: PorV/PorQ family protein, partial [Candidatus Deferrimicrobium sp.]|nr:PorV/PorQ family protein [Candidatus Deferrimicrobium sp.]
SPFSVGVGARALAMGGGFTSLVGDPSAVFYNPAGLAALEFHEVSFMHMSLYEGTSGDYASWVYPALSVGGFGAAYMRIGTDDLTRRRGFVDLGSFDYATSQFLFSFGRQLRSGLAAGISLKVINETIEDYSDYGAGLDFGMTAGPYKNVTIGLMVRDIVPPSLKLDTMAESLPTSIIGGLSLSRMYLTDHVKLTAVFDLEKTETRSPKVRAGAEAVIDEDYALRLGYDRDNMALGAGIVLGRLRIDYAYKFLDYIENSHRISLSIRMGSSVSERERQNREQQRQLGVELVSDEHRRHFAYYKERGDAFYKDTRLDSALAYYYRALAYDEHNAEVLRTIAAIGETRQLQQEKEQRRRETQHDTQSALSASLLQARTFYSEKRYRAALDMVDLVLKIDSLHADAKELYTAIQSAIIFDNAYDLATARSSEQQGQYLAALEAYLRVLARDSSHAEALDGKTRLSRHLDLAQQLGEGIRLFKQGRYVAAREQFSGVLAIDPSEPVANDYAARIDLALAQPPTLEDIQKDEAVWQMYLEGLRAMRELQYEKAIELWEKVLQEYPNNSNTLDNLEQARLRLKSKQPE